MGIRFYCPNGHKLNVKEFQAGRRGICPYCGAKIQIPTESTRPPSKKIKSGAEPREGMEGGAPSGGSEGGVPDWALGPGAPLAAGSPGPEWAAAEPGAAESAVAGAVEPATAEPPAQGPAADSPVGLPSVGSAPQPSPVVAAQNPPSAPAGFSPAVPAAPTPAEPFRPASSGAADPLAQAGEAVWYVRPSSGGQFGPAGSEVMRSWLQQGRVGTDSLVWREGWPDWRQASKVFPQLGGGQPNPPVGKITAGENSTANATAARSRRAKSRRQSRTTQTIIITVLILAVVILSVVFVLVVTGALGGEAGTNTGAASTPAVRHDSARPFLPLATRPPST